MLLLLTVHPLCAAGCLGHRHHHHAGYRPVHMETLLCVNARFASFWPIVHMDPETSQGLGVKKFENTALVFLCGQ